MNFLIILALLLAVIGAVFALLVESREYSYKKKRVFQYGSMIMLIFSIVLMILSPYQKEIELKPDILFQIEKLDNIQKSLTDLRDFIENQKNNLRETENRIKELEQQKVKLEPIIEADKKLIESIFRLQEERNKNKIWLDRLIGFFFGIVSSLIATLIYKMIITRKIE